MSNASSSNSCEEQMRRIGILWPIFERDDYTRIYDHKISSVHNAQSLTWTWRYILTRFNRKHILCGRLFRVQTEQENVSMNFVGKFFGNTISSRKYLKRCLSVCFISVLQCSINFLVPLSVAGHTVSRVLCFQFCRRTVPEVRVRQPMSTLFR